MIRSSSMAFALTLAFGATAFAQTAERAPLSWSVKDGDTFFYAFSSKTEQSLGVGGGMTLSDSTSTISFTITETVKSVTEGVAQIEAEFTSVKLNNQTKAMGMARPAQVYDSSMHDETSMFRYLRSAVGKKFSFKRAADGGVTDVKGGAAIRTELSQAVEEQFKAAAGANGEGGGGGGGMGGGGGGMGGMMGGMGNMARMAAEQITVAFADETLLATLETVNHVLPSEAKAEGESWTAPKNEAAGMLGSLDYVAKFTHGGAINDMTRIKIGLEGEMKLSTGGDADQAGNPMMRMARMMLRDLKMTKAELEGAATFSKGKLVDSEVSRVIEGEGPIPPMLQQMAGGNPDAKMALTMKMVTRYEVQEGPPAKATSVEPSDKPADEKKDEKKTDDRAF